MPFFSVVIPVFNRRDGLRRALQSVANQTMTDFECLVVDDGSTAPIRSVVDEFDDRFRYVRRNVNGGCTAARLTGCEHVRGELMTSLDSDNEFFPWALERAAHYLDAFPEADAAVGLFVFPDGFRVRVGAGVKVVGPDEFVATSSPAAGSDCVGIYRSTVTREWLGLRRDYFNLDFVFELSLRLSHSVVLVDEPWGRYDSSGADRLSAKSNPREFEDIRRFVEEFRPMLGSSPCGPVDVALIHWWQRLVRAGRYEEAAALADWMRDRDLSRGTAVRRKLSWALRTRLPWMARSQVHVL